MAEVDPAAAASASCSRACSGRVKRLAEKTDEASRAEVGPWRIEIGYSGQIGLEFEINGKSPCPEGSSRSRACAA